MLENRNAPILKESAKSNLNSKMDQETTQFEECQRLRDKITCLESSIERLVCEMEQSKIDYKTRKDSYEETVIRLKDELAECTDGRDSIVAMLCGQLMEGRSEHWQRFQLAMPAMLRHLGELLQHVREFPLEAEPATEEMKKPAAVKSGQEDEF